MTIGKWIAVMSVMLLTGGGTAAYLAFGAFLPWREDAEAARLLDLLGVTAGQTAAEIGAGGGRLTLALARQVGPTGLVYSTELNAAQREAIAARVAAGGLSNVRVMEGVANATNLPDGCCDAVVMRAVYHHIQDPAAFTASVARSVAAGGRLAIIDFEPGALWLHGGAAEGTRRAGHGVSRADAIAEFGRAGFVVRHDVRAWSGPLWLVVFERAD
jgi:ubiquinone/menaquinone biosynthesis C-methylase UbiE